MALSKTIANEVVTFDRKKLKSTKSESEEDAFTDYITDIRKSVISEVEQFQSANLSPRKTIEKESIHSLRFDFYHNQLIMVRKFFAILKALANHSLFLFYLKFDGSI